MDSEQRLREALEKMAAETCVHVVSANLHCDDFLGEPPHCPPCIATAALATPDAAPLSGELREVSAVDRDSLYRCAEGHPVNENTSYCMACATGVICFLAPTTPQEGREQIEIDCRGGIDAGDASRATSKAEECKEQDDCAGRDGHEGPCFARNPDC